MEHGEVADEACGEEAHESRRAWSSSSCAAAQSCFAVTERGFTEQEDAAKEEEFDAVTVAETMSCNSLNCCCSSFSRRAVAVEDDEEGIVMRVVFFFAG